MHRKKGESGSHKKEDMDSVFGGESRHERPIKEKIQMEVS